MKGVCCLKELISLAMALFCLGSVPSLAQGAVQVPMKPEAWSYTRNSNPRFENWGGVPAMFIGENQRLEHNEVAYVKDVVIQDGIVEMDVFDSPGNPGFVFRMQSDGDYEVVYFRVGLSGSNKLIQYAPVYNSEVSWALYTRHQGSGYINPRWWTHVKAVFVGSKLEVYLDGRAEPSLVVPKLRRGISAGRIGIWGLLPSYVANFSYTTLPASSPTNQPLTSAVPDSPSVPPCLPNEPKPCWQEVLPGRSWGRQASHGSAPLLIRAWQMSPAFTEDDVHAERYPGVKALGELRWSRVDTDYDGVLPIDKFRAKKLAGVWQDNSHEMVWLKATIQADASTTRLLEFDFSNKVILYLNGRPLFAGAAPWNSKLGYAFGSIAWGANGVYLPLRRGDNELLAAVISESDGWGIMARFDSADGIALR